MVNTSFGQAGGRLRDGLPNIFPTASPGDFRAAAGAVIIAITSSIPNSRRRSPTRGRSRTSASSSRGTLFEVAYVGRRAEHLFGAYDANQVEFPHNGFLDAFNTVKAGGESALINQLAGPIPGGRRRDRFADDAPGVRDRADELTPSPPWRRDFGARIQSGQMLTEQAGLGSVFFFPTRSSSAACGHRFGRLFALPRTRDEARTAVLQRLQLPARLHVLAIEGHALLRSGLHGRRAPQQPVSVEHALRHQQPRPELRPVGFRPAARFQAQAVLRTAVRPGQAVSERREPAHRRPYRRLDAGRAVRWRRADGR